jgi:murein L,D-transpeptidase YcbB/YkuD
VVFNPTWSVPRTIAVEDLLPYQQEDSGYLARHRIRVLSGSNQREIDPAAVDWKRLGPDYFPYRLRQDAGPGNSLGRIKLAMDNPFDIYLHDTPARGLFDLNSRTLGSGCVRLEDAESLTTLVLSADRTWTAADTAERIARGRTEVINLTRGVPIYLVYLTAWVDDEGAVHFRRDIYGRDARVLAALRKDNATVRAHLHPQAL